jgi:7-keto-8-aminopelargonate synthetase-like enzyme
MLNVEDTLVFPSGYLANFAILTSLLKKGDIAYIDERVHASMIDGCLASGATIIRFRHNSPDDLDKKIARTRCSRSLILIEGVYSTEGDLCPLREIKELSARRGIPLMLDDGHGFGILGDMGAGAPQHFGLNGQVEIYVGLFSKVFGSLGGFVAASREVTDYLLRISRGIIFTTALPVAMAAGVLEGVRIVQQDRLLRNRLWSNVARMKEGLQSLGFFPTGGESPILTIRVAHEHTAYQAARALEALGVYVNTFVRPAVKRGESIVRLTISAAHTEADLETAIAAFATVKPLFDRSR